MRPFHRTFLTALCVVFLTKSGLAAEGGWTLAEAIAHARAHHPEVASAEARGDLATATVEARRADRWPRLALEGGYMQTTNPMRGFGAILSQGTFDSTIDFNHPGQIDALTASLQAAYPLYTGGQRSAHLAAAEKQAEAANRDRASVTARQDEAVVDAYFSIRQADAVMRSIEAGIKVLEENLRISRAREASGDLIKTERLNIEVELARLERERLATAHARQLARFRFANVLGLENAAGIELADNDPSVAAMPVPASSSPTRRAEVEAARARLDAAREMLRAARAGRRPSVNAFASVDWNKGFRREGDGDSWTAGVAVRLPIFDGFATRSHVRQAQAQVRIAEEALRGLELNLDLALEQARLNHELAIAQLEVTRQQVLQATEAAELSRERFAQGTLLSTELIGVESRLVEAQVQEALARQSERAALAHYRRAAGLPILP